MLSATKHLGFETVANNEILRGAQGDNVSPDLIVPIAGTGPFASGQAFVVAEVWNAFFILSSSVSWCESIRLANAVARRSPASRGAI